MIPVQPCAGEDNYSVQRDQRQQEVDADKQAFGKGKDILWDIDLVDQAEVCHHAAQREQKKYHIPASITIAQAGLESNWGRSRLANKYNNLFGIKANSDDEKVQMYTTENIRGKNVQVKQYFTVYNSWADSINAHTLLIVNGTADNHARFHGVQTAKTYQQAAYELQRNGYATDPDYASKLIYAIKKFNLAQYDNVK